MPTLSSSVSGPVAKAQSVMSREDKTTVLDPVDSVREELDRWKAWRNTREGTVALELAEHEIRRYDTEISRSSMDYALAGIPSDCAELHRAECRGAKKVWESIMFTPERLEARLKLMQEVLDRGDRLPQDVLEKYS